MKVKFNPTTKDKLLQQQKNTLAERLGIEITNIKDGFVEATMPVDSRTKQPFGILHGGASLALAETLGSLGAICTLTDTSKQIVGLEINANHIKSVSSGYVKGKATPIHVGKTTQIWEVIIVNEQQELICISRITLAVINKLK